MKIKDLPFSPEMVEVMLRALNRVIWDDDEVEIVFLKEDNPPEKIMEGKLLFSVRVIDRSRWN